MRMLIILAILATTFGCSSHKGSKASWPHALHVDGLSFSVTNHPSVLARIDSIKIPELALTNANIYDVLPRLLDLSKESERKTGRPGISIVINRGATAPQENEEIPTSSATEIPLINIHEYNISMLEAIKRISKQIGMQWYLQGDGFLEFGPIKGQPQN